MMSDQERVQLRTLVSMPQWATLERLADQLQDEERGRALSKDTEWETMRTYLRAEGAVYGIGLLVQRAYQEAKL